MAAVNARDLDSTLEDLTFLADVNVGLEEAAHRVGFPSREAAEKWLRKHTQLDLLRRLSDQERRAA
jgi:hypothetical protein